FGSLELVRQEERKGKNSAINEFLDRKKGSVSVLLNADNILRDEFTLSNLISPFSDETVGVTGGRPIPTNDPKSTMGFVVQMMWTRHHYVSMIRPNIGELVAFRDIGIRLPTDMQSDEAIIKSELEKKGYVSVYVPDAVILNRGPETVSDFIKQRTRINIGEEFIRKKYGYVVRSRDKHLFVSTVLDTIREMGLHPFRMFFAVVLETISRHRARAHARFKGNDMNIWERVESTKNVKR
ncbi:MAG: glycosyltransferase, partial [Methanomassiliicoccaceae archaeon]|nr:glycosyltransferase [Methanomassiliicoccaceae archaeon]